MTEAVIMAGGRGLRLHPLTARTPKPLLKVGSKPILERIVEQLVHAGVQDITFCVHYMAEKITEYFGDGSRFGFSAGYFYEKAPMGTVGGLHEIRASGPVIVCNGDIVADIDFAKLMKFHAESPEYAVMATALYQHQIPYGVVEMEPDLDVVAQVREKPIENFSVAAGIYVLPARAVRLIKPPMDMPDLLAKIPTRAFPIEGYWCDIGRFESLAKAHIDWTVREQ